MVILFIFGYLKKNVRRMLFSQGISDAYEIWTVGSESNFALRYQKKLINYPLSKT